MPGQPAVSVLLATWNDLHFLREAVESILAQTHADFEFVIVDDGSTDQTAGYLRSLGEPRVRVMRLPENQGVAGALNAGLAECRGRYVARMDADDIAEPDRLGRQFEFLEAHAEIGVVGSARLLIDEQGSPIAPAPVMIDDLSIRWKCLLGNPLPHPTVMLRRQVLDRHSLRYDPTYRAAQDYELWTRLLPVTRAANLSDSLLRYRIRASSISRSRRLEQLANHDRIALIANRRLLPEFPLTGAQLSNLRARYGGQSVRDESLNRADEAWIELLTEMLRAFVAAYRSHDQLDGFMSRQLQWIDGFRSASPPLQPGVARAANIPPYDFRYAHAR